MLNYGYKHHFQGIRHCRVTLGFAVGSCANAAGAVRPGMFFCGNDAAAKSSVATLLTDLGWEPVDVGGLAQALHLEHMTLLWIRMVRVGGASPHTVWSRLPTRA